MCRHIEVLACVLQCIENISCPFHIHHQTNNYSHFRKTAQLGRLSVEMKLCYQQLSGNTFT